MSPRRAIAFATVLLPTLAGCGNDALPGTILGSYTRRESDPTGAHTHDLQLHVTSTGMTVTGPAMGGSVKPGSTGSALFKKMRCTDDTSCRFTTETGCEGTLQREQSGAVVIVAVGDCEGFSGKWTPGAAGAPPPPASVSASGSAPPEPASAPPPAPVSPQPGTTGTARPGTTGSPSATATAAPSTSGPATAVPTAFPSGPPPQVSCLAACNDASVACIRNCKVGDLDCMKACSSKMAECAQKCP